MNKNIFEPIPIIISAEKKESDNIRLREKEYSFKDNKEYIYHITHNVSNKKQKNGRIYYEMINGKITANSVSPYSEKFFENIENEVKELVSILIKKRYLTYSSCEGHDFSFRRYVGLAFADEETRSYVEQYVKSINIFGVKTKLINSVLNMKAQQLEKKAPTVIKVEEKVSEEDEAFYFNIEFHRNYQKYYFLEIIILDEISFEKESFIKEIKKFLLKKIKKYLWNFITKKLEKKLNDKKFKKYPY